MNSKVIIDATRQLPAEGGPKSWPADNRATLEELAAEAFPAIDEKPEYMLRSWLRT